MTAGQETVKVEQILETCLYASDLVAAEAFYRDVLGLEPFARKAGRHLFFRCGRRVLLLFDPEATSRPGAGVPAHGAHGPGHVAFAVREAELDGWRDRLRAHGVAIEQEIAWPRGGRSLYFRDPAGNSLELASAGIWGGDEEEVIGG
jgi:catechol 2,3-dioxygenase-like lactoylglutathione lyase family enzyme